MYVQGLADYNYEAGIDVCAGTKELILKLNIHILIIKCGGHGTTFESPQLMIDLIFLNASGPLQIWMANYFSSSVSSLF